MGLILLEALGALLIFVGIIWWTMFSGRKNGELAPGQRPAPSPAAGRKKALVSESPAVAAAGAAETPVETSKR
jgi:hypothetical protein